MNRAGVYIFLFVIGLLAAFYYFSRQSDVRHFLETTFDKQKSKPSQVTRLYHSPTGSGEKTQSIWLWIKSTGITKSSETYYIEGFLGGDKDKPIKLQIGRPDDLVGYASTPKVEFNSEFPNRYPRWGVKKTSELNTIFSPGSWIIAKVKIEKPVVTQKCEGSCKIRLDEIKRLLKNNIKLSSTDKSSKFKEKIETGPAAQILIETKKE